jgi:hypothetical protein
MGYDMTYHPIAADDIKKDFFDALLEPDGVQRLAKKFRLDAKEADYIGKLLVETRTESKSKDFEFWNNMVYRIAQVAGFLRKYWYLRGSTLTELTDNPLFARYFADWRTLVPEVLHKKYLPKTGSCVGGLKGNYCGGVYVPHDKLIELRADYESNPGVRAAMDESFSHDRLPVFWKAVDFAIAHKLGLLEAADVLIPNPVVRNKDGTVSPGLNECFTAVWNCDKEGIFLYHIAAMQQISQMLQAAHGGDKG